MINLRKLTQSRANALLESVSESEAVAEATQIYGDKTFRESHRGAKTFAVWLSGIAQLISAVLASSFFYFKIALPSLPFQVPYLTEGIAVLLSVMVLILLEVLKRHLFEALAVSFFRSKSKQVSFKVWLVPIALLLTVISIYTSFEGAKLFVSQNDKSTAIASDYRKQIAEIEAQEKQFKNSISWKGKIDTYNKTNAKILAGFQDRKTALHQEKNKEIDVHKSDIEGKGMNTAIFSLIMELLAISAIFFVSYVNFYVFIESKTAVALDSNEENNQVQKIGFSTIPQSTIAPQVNKVGFQFGGNQNVITQSVNNESVITLGVNTNPKTVKVGDKFPCENCGKVIVKKTITHRFCCQECRLQWHNKENGFNLNLFNLSKKGSTK